MWKSSYDTFNDIIGHHVVRIKLSTLYQGQTQIRHFTSGTFSWSKINKRLAKDAGAETDVSHL